MNKLSKETRKLESGEGAASRRDSFVKTERPSKTPPRRGSLLLVPLLIAAAVVVAVLAMRATPQPAAAQVTSPDGFGYPVGINSEAANKRYPAIAADAGGEIRVPTGAFADGKSRFFTTRLPSGTDVNFFVVRSSDGTIRAAFDSCDVCYSAHKGYHQEADTMVCNNCGQRFASNKINEVRGGCNPVPLERSVQGESLVIKLADLQRGNRAENGQPLF